MFHAERSGGVGLDSAEYLRYLRSSRGFSQILRVTAVRFIGYQAPFLIPSHFTLLIEAWQIPDCVRCG